MGIHGKSVENRNEAQNDVYQTNFVRHKTVMHQGGVKRYANTKSPFKHKHKSLSTKSTDDMKLAQTASGDKHSRKVEHEYSNIILKKTKEGFAKKSSLMLL